MLNGMAPNNQPDISRLYVIDSKPPVLWLRGDSDQVIADMSMFDLATFGKMGVIPGWPGDEVCPPQPMINRSSMCWTITRRPVALWRRSCHRRLWAYALRRKGDRLQSGAARLFGSALIETPNNYRSCNSM